MKKASKTNEPSAESLREMPETTFPENAQRGRFYKKAVARGGYHAGPQGKAWVPMKAGRPPKGTEAVKTTPKSIRLPEHVWALLDVQAKKKHTTRHKFLQHIIIEAIARGNQDATVVGSSRAATRKERPKELKARARAGREPARKRADAGARSSNGAAVAMAAQRKRLRPA
jgi:hypothetical protein